ncbi:MAG: WD40 repeat domain-containing protein [Myxococcota bacterium]
MTQGTPPKNPPPPSASEAKNENSESPFGLLPKGVGTHMVQQGFPMLADMLALKTAGRAPHRFVEEALSEPKPPIWLRKPSREGHRGKVTSLVVFQDGANGEPRVVSGSDDGFIKVWDCETGTCLRSWEASRRKITCLAVLGQSVSEKTRVVSGSDDGTVKVWDPDSATCLGSWEMLRDRSRHDFGHIARHKCRWGQITSLAVFRNSVNGKPCVVSRSMSGAIRVWNPNPQTGGCFDICNEPDFPVTCLAVLEEDVSGEPRVVSGSMSGAIRVWAPNPNPNTGRLLLSVGDGGPAVTVTSLAAFQDPLSGAPSFVSGSADGTIWVWNLQSATCRKTRTVHLAQVTSLAVFQDPRTRTLHIVSGSTDGTIQVLDLQSGRRIHTLAGHRERVHAVAVCHCKDGPLIVSGSENGTIKYWRPDGRCLYTILPPS